MQCELCKESTRHNIIAVFTDTQIQVCKECANALFVNREVLKCSIVEPMPKG